MKYMLAYLIQGEIQRYQKQLMSKIGDIMQDRSLCDEKPIPQHITLHSPFHLVDADELEPVVEQFAAAQERGSIKIHDFGQFENAIFCLEGAFSLPAQRAQAGLVNLLRDELGIPGDKFDLAHNPHATLGYATTEESFRKVQEYLSSIPKPNFSALFDNITILSKPGRLWEVHKIYNVGGN